MSAQKPNKPKNPNVIGAVLIMLTFIAVQILGVVAVILLQSQPPAFALNATVIINLAGAFFALWLNYRYQIKYSFEVSPPSSGFVLKWGLIGTALAYIAQVLIVSIEIVLLGEPTTSANTESIMQMITSNPLFILLPVISAPIIEELVFRKAINGLLVDKIGWIGSSVISALLFAFVHFDGLILTYAAMGLVFSYIYYKTQNIWGPIIAHMGLNILATVLNLLV